MTVDEGPNFLFSLCLGERIHGSRMGEKCDCYFSLNRILDEFWYFFNGLGTHVAGCRGRPVFVLGDFNARFLL